MAETKKPRLGGVSNSSDQLVCLHSGRCNVDRRRTFRTLLSIKCNLLPFIEGLVAASNHLTVPVLTNNYLI